MQVERTHHPDPFGVKDVKVSGKRVRNTWVTCLWFKDNSSKGLLILDNTLRSFDHKVKDGL